MTKAEKLEGLRGLIYHALNTIDELIEAETPAPAEEKTLPLSSLKIDPERLYNQGEAAQHLGIGSGTLARMADNGKIKCKRPNGPEGYRKFLGADIISYLKNPE